MKKVILLGDSIRIGYQNEVIKRLGLDFEVYTPDENCKFSSFTLNSLRFWLPHCPNPDVIHWNNGLWDVRRLFPEDGCFTQIDRYIEDMGRILRELKKTGAKIIFALTTPTRQEENGTEANFLNADIASYNEKFLEHYKDDVDGINNLYNLVYPRLSEYICDDLTHLSKKGAAVCGKATADCIRRVITMNKP